MRLAATNWRKVWARLSLPRGEPKQSASNGALTSANELGSACSKLLLAALLSAVAGCGSAAHRTLEETFEQTYTIEPTAEVTVINGEGAVFVYGSNTNEMRVQAVKRAYTGERLKQIAVDVSAQPGSVSINTKFPPKPKWALFDRSGTVDYTIVAPAAAKLTRLELGAGEVLVDGMRGERTHASLRSGRMFARNCFGNVALTLDRGTLTLAYDWWETGNFSIKANVAHGNTWAFLPAGIICHLVAKTGHGKIGNDFDEPAQRGPKETVDTLIHGGGDARITIRTTSGDLKIVKAGP